jgi:hypothetical protein
MLCEDALLDVIWSIAASSLLEDSAGAPSVLAKAASKKVSSGDNRSSVSKDSAIGKGLVCD